MRSHEERIAETKRRIAKIEREKRLRRDKITMISAAAACLALLIGASFAMPGIAANIQTGNYSGFRECHITPDWLLIYEVRESELILVLSRTGTHSDLF